MLTKAETLKPDINDWTITSLSGSYREFGGSIANNAAALLSSAQSTVPNTNTGAVGEVIGGATLASAIGNGSAYMASKGQVYNRIDPDLLEHLIEINDERKVSNAINSSVTVEEMGEFPVIDKKEKAEEKKDQQ